MFVTAFRASMEGYCYLQNTVSVIIAVLGLLVCSPDSVQAQCTTFYIEEPPPELFCNPYLFDEVLLACTVLVDSLLPVSVNLSIEWYHVPSGQSEAQLIGRSDFLPLLTTHEGFSSEIIIRNVAEGSYYCQPVIAGSGPLLPSHSTRIDPFYSQFNPCNSLAARSSRCAEEGAAPQSAPSFFFIPITLTEFANFDTAHVPTPPPTLISGCPYQYIEEPPLDPTCNPYPANAIGLSCALLIDASQVPGHLIIIDWLYKSSDDAIPTVLRSTPFHIGIGLATVRTSLTITVSNRPEGTYFCQPLLLQENTSILPSKQLMVGLAGSYDSLPPCNGDVVSVPSMRCALKLNLTMIDVINTQNSTQPPNSTLDNSFKGLPVWKYAIAAIGTVILVCVGVVAMFSVMFCCRKKSKATAANRIGQTLAGESPSKDIISPLVTRGQSEALSTRTASSHHYYSRPQWPTLRDDVEQSIASSEMYTLPRTCAYTDSSNTGGNGSCGGSCDGKDEPTTEREYSSPRDATTGTERPIRVPSPFEEALSTSTDYCNDSTPVRVCVNKNSEAANKRLDPTKGGEEDMSYENNGLYPLPARSIQKAEGSACNKGQNDCQSLPERPKSPVGAYQGLSLETMDYVSLYSRRVAPSSSQPYRALESSKMQRPTSYTRPVWQ